MIMNIDLIPELLASVVSRMVERSTSLSDRIVEEGPVQQLNRRIIPV